jgi:hypothetical protein
MNKKIYKKPKLQSYGDIKTITKAKSTGPVDSDNHGEPVPLSN